MQKIFLLTVLAHGLAAADPAATLLTLDGKRLAGTPSALVPSPGAAPDWVITTDDQPLTLKQADILEMRMANPIVPETLAGEHALLTFNNGDSVQGHLATVTDSAVTVHTGFAGELTFRRDMIASLRMVTPATVLFTGPAPDQWTFTPSSGAWTLGEGSLSTKVKGEAATTVEYPEKFRLGVDLEWKHDPQRFRGFTVVVLADEQDTSRSGYKLDCTGPWIDLRKLQSGEDAEPLGFSESVVEFVEKLNVRLELLVDTNAGTITMLVDGRTVGTWADKSPITPAGASKLLFLSSHNYQEVRASRIRLSSWDGNLEAVAAEDPAIKLIGSGASQQLLLRNGDVVQAEHLELKNGGANVETVYGDFRIPTSRIRSVASPKLPGNPPTPRKMLGDVRAWFPNGGHLTFRLDQIKDAKATGFSQLFGTAEFDLNSFERIEMNLDNRTLQAQRAR